MRLPFVGNREYRPFKEVDARDSSHELIDVPLCLEVMRVGRGLRILEVGCGTGCGLVAIAATSGPSHLVGLDIDDERLGRAATRINETKISAQLICSDVRASPLADCSFDVILDFGTCYHIARPAAALAEISRMLRPGGLFIHETVVSQRLTHPLRSFGRWLSFRSTPELIGHRRSLLWAARKKVARR